MRGHAAVDGPATEGTAHSARHDADRATDQRMADQRATGTTGDQTGRAARMAADAIVRARTVVMAGKGGRSVERAQWSAWQRRPTQSQLFW
jgi:hypothetical protein